MYAMRCDAMRCDVMRCNMSDVCDSYVDRLQARCTPLDEAMELCSWDPPLVINHLVGRGALTAVQVAAVIAK